MIPEPDTARRSTRILLIGIGGVYNYGCEALVRGTENILRAEYPNADIVYASRRPEDDRTRLAGSNVRIVERRTRGRYSCRNVCRKLLSLMGIRWTPVMDRLKLLGGVDAVLSIGGDLYTLSADGKFERSFLKFGDAVCRRRVPYVLWGASVGPFSENPEAEKVFAKHLKGLPLLAVREAATVDYLRTLGVVDNVVPCADPAYTVAPEITADYTSRRNGPIIGVNLSPLSVAYTDHSLQEVVCLQARALEGLIGTLGARIVLVPHVVCNFREGDDDLRYLRKVKDTVSPRHRGQVSLLDNDAGFVGVKKELARCDMVIAARMHCAINALTAQVPTILLSYSRKSVGMCRYVYGNDDWVMPLGELAGERALERKAISMLEQQSRIHAYLTQRIPEIQQDAYRPMTTLRNLLAG